MTMYETLPVMIKCLLCAGADPMARMRHIDSYETIQCFWEGWLEALFSRWKAVERYEERANTISRLGSFEFTRRLLTHGAALDQDTTHLLEYFPNPSPERLGSECVNIYLRMSALDCLNIVLKKDTQWQNFSKTTRFREYEPKPRIELIDKPYARKHVSRKACPSTKESEALWHLIKHWDETRDEVRYEAVHAEAVRILEAHKTQSTS